MFRIIALAFALAAMPVGVASASEKGRSCPEIEKIVIGGFPPSYAMLPFYYALEKGFDVEDCLDVEIRLLGGVSNMAIALNTNQVDAITSPDTIWWKMRKGEVLQRANDWVITAQLADRQMFAIVGRPNDPIVPPEVVEPGKKPFTPEIAVNTCPTANDRVQGTTGLLTLHHLKTRYPDIRVVCRVGGRDRVLYDPPASRGTVRLVPRSFSSKRFACVQIGECASAILTLPQYYVAVKELGLDVKVGPLEFVPFCETCLVMRRSKAEALDKHGALARLVNVYLRGARAFAENPEEAKAFMMRYARDAQSGSFRTLKLVPEKVGEVYELAREHVWSTDGCFEEEALKNIERMRGPLWRGEEKLGVMDVVYKHRGYDKNCAK